jgi:hypothetical protein
MIQCFPGLSPHRFHDVRNRRPANLDDVPEPDALNDSC